MKDEINTTAEEKLLTDYRHIITKYYTDSPLVQVGKFFVTGGMMAMRSIPPMPPY